jgi:hypothetical protein
LGVIFRAFTISKSLVFARLSSNNCLSNPHSQSDPDSLGIVPAHQSRDRAEPHHEGQWCQQLDALAPAASRVSGFATVLLHFW